MARRSRSALERAAQAERLRARPARGRILEAARELSVSRGYQQVRVGELASVAGVSRETFYTHFANKRACFAEAIDPRLGEIEAHCRSAQEEGEGWAVALMATVEAALDERCESNCGPRGRVLSALLEQVAEKGYAATRLNEVLGVASVSHPSFYRHFEGKDVCFAVAYSSLLRRVEERVEVAAATDRFGRLVALAEILSAEPGTARILIDEAAMLPPIPESDERAHPRSFAELIERLLRGPGDPGVTDGAQEQLIAGAALETLRRGIRSGDAAALPGQIEALLSLFGPHGVVHVPAHRGRAARRHGGRSARPVLAPAG